MGRLPDAWQVRQVGQAGQLQQVRLAGRNTVTTRWVVASWQSVEYLHVFTILEGGVHKLAGLPPSLEC